jgi:2-polyprenyl-3-methyl-5-hydroxy-6-metoxy-1,4-benzoquinol methylase
MQNIEYESNQISEFYMNHRMTYNDFYPSERKIINDVFSALNDADVLDIGCACGGLGKALSEEFNISRYTGIDINKQAIEWAKNNNRLPIPHEYIDGDVLKHNLKKTDVVFSLSCADWNIETNSIIQKCWDSVKDGGYLILSLRLTDKETINDIEKSYQYIDFFNKNDTREKANYVIFNIFDALKILKELSPHASEINAYGYFGTPSQSAKTPYSELLFGVFAIKKGDSAETTIKLDVPLKIFV